MTTPPPPPPPGAMQPSGASGNSDDKTMALLAHFGIILFGFLAPLIVYLVKSDSPWVKKEAAKAFNFTIIFTVVWVVLFMGRIVLYAIDDTGIISLMAACAGCLLFPAAWIVNAVFGVMNGIKANNGEETKYPFEVPILK